MKYSNVVNGEIVKSGIRKGSIYNGTRFGYKDPDSVYAKYNLYPEVGSKPTCDNQISCISPPAYTVVGEAVQVTWEVTDIPLDILKKSKVKRLNRDAKIAEEAGITLANGMFARTDKKTQDRLTQAALQGQLDSTLVYNWKGPDGVFVQLAVPEIIAIAQAVNQHVQACFTREMELTALINACSTIEELQAIESW